MCEYCEDVRLVQCRIMIEDRIGIRDKMTGKLETIPDFKEMLIPLKYCPYCGRKL